jgi:hypothetical protein
MGCYTEATTGRALAQGYTTAQKTVKMCVDTCSAKNYIYAGLEYGGEVSSACQDIEAMLTFSSVGAETRLGLARSQLLPRTVA